MSASKQVWLITGASSGFGRCMAETVLEKGDITIATARNPSTLADLQAKYSKDRLLVLRLDVTQSDEIAATFEAAKQTFGRIDVVFNNAGRMILAEVEGSPINEARALFETNFWAAIEVSLAAVKFFREVNKPVGGRLLNVSSGAGAIGIPGLGFYAASKHALEGLSKSLAQELDPEWNIKVTIIQPSDFRTPIGSQNGLIYPRHEAYRDSTGASFLRGWLGEQEAQGKDPSKAAARFYELAHLDNPPLHLAIGKFGIQGSREEMKRYTGDIDRYEEWSESLEFDQ